jgi:D-3-phosphoglycerate dehydrogenase
MLRCALLDDYQNVALKMADWSPLKGRVALTVFNEGLGAPDAVAEKLRDFDIVCLMRERTAFPRDVIAALPNLKLVVTTGMRNAAIDLAALKERGIPVCGTGYAGQPTADLAFGLMLELMRKIGFENARLHAGAPWQVTIGQGLEGRTLGLVGLGHLGTRMARIGLAFGMEVIAWSQNLTPERCAEHGVIYASKDELFARADIVSIHTVLSKRTRGLIGADDLARMKPSAYLINTARGPIVDEAALLAALRDKRIAGAGLDVFWEEPLARDHPIRSLDNVVLTPHLGYVTEETYRRFYREIVENIAAWLDGAPVRLVG